ncbi:MAG TPA: NHLP family bacteriocin export ABC transporter peptidase/permease/ATPase subunit [Burkholderiales bacterium]|nr:NHLP family bacteriocin export ABC transporter peptidase/permease/ATPase subunit [Burkholderiales bacterium]
MSATPAPKKAPRLQRKRTPTILQMEAVECGATALAIVMAYYKRYVPAEELRLACGVSRDGSKASNVVRTARNYGFNAKGIKREPGTLHDVPLPFIVFWNFNHFLVVEGFGPGRVYLNDPASGRRSVTVEEFDHSFTGVVLALEPGPDFKRGGEPPDILVALRSRLVGAHSALTYLFLAGLAMVLPGLVVPVFTKVFIDEVLVQHFENWVRPLLLGMVLTMLLMGALSWVKSYYLARFRTVLGVTTASRFFWHVLRLPIVFYAQRSAGEVAGRVAINERVAGLLAGQVAEAVLNVLMVVFYALLMFFYDWVLTLVGVLTAVGNIAFMRYISRRQVEANQKLAIDSGKLIGASMNGLRLIETLKASGLEGDFFAKWSGYQSKVMNGMQSIGATSLWLGTVPPFLTTLNGVLVIGIGGLRVMDGHLSMGMLVAFQALMAGFTGPINQLVGLGSQIQELQGDMNRLDDVLKYKLDPRAGGELAAPPPEDMPPKLNGSLELRNVTFGYSPLDPPLLKDFSLTLKPGDRVALVGPSGCGKSTISKLVLGLYEIWEGEILFDGRTRDEIPRDVLVNSLALVDQDITLFSGTVRDNLTLWDDSIAEADVIQAAKDAEIHSIIAARPGSYDSRVGEQGGNFSGGQRQRLEIARALATNPSILVLDEATSALDPVTEQHIDANIRARGATCLIVAHRLSAIRDCDEIIVLNRGQVVQRGTHDELKQDKSNLYVRLIQTE